MRILFTLLLTSFFTFLLAQPESQYLSVADSDPAATKLVREMRQKYEGYSSMQATFRLDIEFPGQAVESQTGSLSKSGDLFRFKLGDQEGIGDGEALYVILHDNKEVQINNLPEEGEDAGMLTPQNLFSFYDQGQFILALQGEETQNGRRVQLIEMKPVNRAESDFTKLRMIVDKQRKDVVKLMAFARDGSRFTFHLDKVTANQAIPAARFKFNKSDFTGYHITDLRF